MLGCYCCFSFFRTSEIAAQNASQAPAKSCLWKVVSKESTVYLLGSVHLLKSDAYPLSQAIEQAFDDVDQARVGSESGLSEFTRRSTA